MIEKYVVGVDFGSDSARAIVINAADGSMIGQGISEYPRWKKGLYQHPETSKFRQHPLDYLEALNDSVKKALMFLDNSQKKNICGIGVDTTGSTPAPVNQEGIPLALLPEFADCEDAMFHLWKDHSASQEAIEIQKIFSENLRCDYTQYQGTYCSEWFWAKILHTVRENKKIRKASYTWEEHCDWIVGVLCGESRPEKIYHSSCAAGHKALWHSKWNGLPDEQCLEKLDPYLVQVARRYGKNPAPAGTYVGKLEKKWAENWGISENIVVAGSSFDAHAGAVGAGISLKRMICTIGTSAVDMLVEKAENLRDKRLVRLCGQAEDSILPGYIGIETGQAAFGDVFAWFKRLLTWPVKQYDIDSSTLEKIDDTILERLSKEAQNLPEEPFPITVDWFNGRRYPDTDDFAKATISNLSLGVTAPMLYRSLVFGTVCGLKQIVDGLEEEKIEINDVVAVGGIAHKSPYVMQMIADVLQKEVETVDSKQTCAQGAAIYAALAAKIYPDMECAIRHMSARKNIRYYPDSTKHVFYERKYNEYQNLILKMKNL